MSKTDVREIDVRRGDTWTAHPSEFRLLQHRDGKNREIASLGYSRWHDHCASWESIPSWMAMDAIGRLGYTLTRDDGKGEGGDEAKPADVPVVDAVWVEISNAVGGENLYAYSSRESATFSWREQIEAGTARIVRIRPDADAIKAVVREMMEGYSATDHNARAMADDAKMRAADAIQLANDARDRGRKANERLDALESRLAAEKPADKDAARVVKVPTFAPSRVFSIAEKTMIYELNGKWKDALTAAGVKWEEGK